MQSSPHGVDVLSLLTHNVLISFVICFVIVGGGERCGQLMLSHSILTYNIHHQ